MSCLKARGVDRVLRFLEAGVRSFNTSYRFTWELSELEGFLFLGDENPTIREYIGVREFVRKSHCTSYLISLLGCGICPVRGYSMLATVAVCGIMNCVYFASASGGEHGMTWRRMAVMGILVVRSSWSSWSSQYEPAQCLQSFTVSGPMLANSSS